MSSTGCRSLSGCYPCRQSKALSARAPPSSRARSTRPRTSLPTRPKHSTFSPTCCTAGRCTSTRLLRARATGTRERIQSASSDTRWARSRGPRGATSCRGAPRPSAAAAGRRANKAPTPGAHTATRTRPLRRLSFRASASTALCGSTARHPAPSAPLLPPARASSSAWASPRDLRQPVPS